MVGDGDVVDVRWCINEVLDVFVEGDLNAISVKSIDGAFDGFEDGILDGFRDEAS